MKIVGQTKNGYFQFGLRKTFPLPYQVVWDFMFSKKGLPIWLGKIEPENLEIKKEFQLSNGISFNISTFKPYSHLRMTWKKKNHNNTSRLQVRIYPVKDKTVISFAHEMMKDAAQREEMKKHWNSVMEELGEYLMR